MREIFFVAKVFGISLILLVLMQVRIGQLTLEERASAFIQESWLTSHMQTTADGLEKLISQMTGSVGKKMSAIFRKDEIRQRGDFKLDRSEAYRKLEEAKQSASLE